MQCTSVLSSYSVTMFVFVFSVSKFCLIYKPVIKFINLFGFVCTFRFMSIRGQHQDDPSNIITNIRVNDSCMVKRNQN